MRENTSSGASATLFSHRRIPFACRSQVRFFKRVLWVTPLLQNSPPDSFGVANHQGESLIPPVRSVTSLQTNRAGYCCQAGALGNPQNSQACPCTCPFRHGKPRHLPRRGGSGGGTTREPPKLASSFRGTPFRTPSPTAGAGGNILAT